MESYTSIGIQSDQSLFESQFLIDFTKDLGIRDVQFADTNETYKRTIQTSCIECQNFTEHFEQLQIEQSLCERINYINDVISGNSLLLVSEYRYRLEVLNRLKLIDDKNFVLLKGKVALEISLSELFITELIKENVFSQMQPCEIVSLLSAIVFQQKPNKPDENYFKTSFNNDLL